MRVISSGEERTLELGAKLSHVIPKGTVVALHGDLGAGKTVLSRGFARGLGITEAVTSPTFTVVQEYAIPTGGWFYHLDMYRITDEASALAFGIDEYLFNPQAITLVEWPERIEKLLDTPHTIHITLSHEGEETRALKLPDELAAKL